MKYLLARLRERSTYQGLVTLLAAFGIYLSPEMTEAIIAASIGAAGLVHALFPQSGVIDAGVNPVVSVWPLGPKPSPLGALLAAVLLAGPLSACGAVPWNDQNDAGITRAEFSTALDKEGKPYIDRAKFVSGKELAEVNVKLKHPTGIELEYSAKSVAAFRGQEIRGGVEGKVSGDLKEAVPDVAKTIRDIVVPVPLP